MKKFRNLALLLSLVPCFSYAQVAHEHNQSNNHPKGCGTDLVWEQKLKQNPDLLQLQEQFDAYAAEYIQKYSVQKRTDETDKRTVYTIPVVVHVVHTGWGNDDSISVEQVRSEFEVAFNYYRQIPGTFGCGGEGSDSYIEFSLASKDPAGNPHPGVVYLNNPTLAKHNINDDGLALKTATVWPRNKYMNVWVIKEMVPNGVAGYATFPGWGSDDEDGVVLVYNTLGTLGATSGPKNIPSHEFGHWLSLFHPFQGGCGTTNCLTSGDRVCDTPPVQSEQFKPVTIRLNTCNNDAPDRPDNQRNIMDYASENSRPNFLSKGQIKRMHSTLETPQFTIRYPLWQESNLQATGTGPYGKPTAYFWASKTANRRISTDEKSGLVQTCVGAPIQFFDYSRNSPTTFHWEFPGGTPATSTEMHPVVTYNQPGDYGVKLVVSNFGGVDSLERQVFVRVVDSVAVGHTEQNPFFQGFDAIPFPPPGWWVQNYDLGKRFGAQTWERNNLNSGFNLGGRCALMDMYTYDDFGQQDGLISPRVRITPENASLSFSYAYSPLRHRANAQGGNSQSFQLLYTDTLQVMVSKDCGETWNTLWKKGGMELMTTAAVLQSDAQGAGTDLFEVQTSEWRSIPIELNQFVGQDINVQFRTINGFGNKLYLDDVRIPATFTAMNELSAIQNSLTFAPNPTEGGITTLHFESATAGKAQVEVYNILGSVVYHSNLPYSAGKQSFNLNLKDLPAGIYTAKVSLQGHSFTKKLQVLH